MRLRFFLRACLAFGLLLGITVYAGRIGRLAGAVGLDLSGRGAGSLTADTRRFLRALDARLAITYLVSPRQHMPSQFTQVEDHVRALLGAMRAEARDRIEVRVLYPELSGAVGAAYAARHRASSFRVEHVARDERDEQAVWSSLVLQWGRRREVLIQGIGPEHLPNLEELIVARLQAEDDPPRPVYAVASPPGFALLRSFLAQSGRVLDVDLTRGTAIPDEADVLFWMQPLTWTPAHQRQLQRFLEAGRTAVLAGSAYTVDCVPADGGIRYAVRELGRAWELLLRPLGLRPVADLLMDRNTGPLSLAMAGGDPQQVDAPFHLRLLPAFYDLKSFAGPARGGLTFPGASALEVNPLRVAEAGYRAEVVGTTTEHAWVAPFPPGRFSDAEVARGLAVPKQNLMVLLKPGDPRRGEVLVLASAALFRDGVINQPGYAHQVFLRTLTRTYSEPERLVRGQLPSRTAPELPPVGDAARIFWRVWAAFLVPAAVLATGAWLHLRGGLVAVAPGRTALAIAGGLAAVVAIGYGCRLGQGAQIDLTRDRLNSVSARARQILSPLADRVRAELYVTSPAAMPPAFKRVEDRAVAVLRACGIESRTLRPESLPDRQRQELRRFGLEPFVVEHVVRDSLVPARVWSGIRLVRGNGEALIPRLDGRSVNHLEFLLSAAVRRLQGGAGPLVAVAADMPRLSPAEAMEDYHRKGLIPPTGTDVYSEVTSLLAEYGYRVAYVNPRVPELPPDADVLLWLQPRRDSTPVLVPAAAYLARGGRAIVAMQHFNIQQRQYRGTGFETVYWPQPQFQDLDRYLRLVGVEQVREVLMDRTRARLSLETQVNRTAVREYDPQAVALPFLIRTVAANYPAAHPVTERLGDLLFIWGNRFAVERERLEQLGMESQVLVTTSAEAWAYPWQGGWLPPETLIPSGPMLGRQPLALILEGVFPAVSVVADEEGRSVLEALPPDPGAPEGRLLLIGSSEMFKDAHLYEPGFQHDQLLLNAVAYLGHGEDMARLQARRPAARGFGYISPQAKLFWRSVVVGLGPVLLGLLALACYGAERRKSTP